MNDSIDKVTMDTIGIHARVIMASCDSPRDEQATYKLSFLRESLHFD